MCLCDYVCDSVCVCVCVRACVRAFVCVRLCACVRACVRACVCVCVCVSCCKRYLPVSQFMGGSADTLEAAQILNNGRRLAVSVTHSARVRQA